MSDHTADLYFEAHITTEAIVDGLLSSRVVNLGNAHGFRMSTSQSANLFIARGTNYESIEELTHSMVRYLTEYGVVVKRYMIGNTLIDVELPWRK